MQQMPFWISNPGPGYCILQQPSRNLWIAKEDLRSMALPRSWCSPTATNIQTPIAFSMEVQPSSLKTQSCPLIHPVNAVAPQWQPLHPMVRGQSRRPPLGKGIIVLLPSSKSQWQGWVYLGLWQLNTCCKSTCTCNTGPASGRALAAIFNECAMAHWCATDGLWVCHENLGGVICRGVFMVPQGKVGAVMCFLDHPPSLASDMLLNRAIPDTAGCDGAEWWH